jgi:hypothetical protein
VQPFARDVAHHDAAGDGLRGKKVGVSSTVGSSSVWGGGGRVPSLKQLACAAAAPHESKASAPTAPPWVNE